MSEGPNQSQQVSFPLVVAEQLMKCYYGNGPRHGEPKLAMAPYYEGTEVDGQTPEVAQPIPETTPPAGGPVAKVGQIGEPKGYAATKLEGKDVD